MNPNTKQTIKQTVGFILLLAGGVVYSGWVMMAAFFSNGETDYLVKNSLISIASIVTAICLFTLLLPPNKPWLYPLAFSTASLLLFVTSLVTGAFLMTWFVLSISTLAIALITSYCFKWLHGQSKSLN
jgi:hypothetical protein